MEHKAFLAIKFLNFNLKVVGEKRFLQLNEIEEIHFNAYESLKLYKGRMKSWHDRHIHSREFQEGDLVVLFSLRLKLFSSNLYLRWSGPFKVIKIYPYGAIDIGTEATGNFKANRSWLEHYNVGEPIDGKVCYNLLNAASS